jgi:predicted RNA-binding protein with TRAM domain
MLAQEAVLRELILSPFGVDLFTEAANSDCMWEHGFKGRKPVEEGKEYTVTITDIGSQGDGVAKVDGFIVFVPEARVGKTYKVKVTKVMSKAAFAKIVE